MSGIPPRRATRRVPAPGRLNPHGPREADLPSVPDLEDALAEVYGTFDWEAARCMPWLMCEAHLQVRRGGWTLYGYEPGRDEEEAADPEAVWASVTIRRNSDLGRLARRMIANVRASLGKVRPG